MKTITTKNGFVIDIDEEVFDDMEVVDLLAEVEENPLVTSKLLTKTLGKDGKKAMYDFVRNDKGRVPSGAAMELFEEILNLAGEEVKNF